MTMNKSIIIDSAHKEETRVVVLENGILQDFDREAISVKQIKGNIYLAKVIRVEPSLQAAFVDYGNERHGFLPFADIHPEYYTLPEAEKQKLRDSFSSDNAQKEAAEESREGAEPSAEVTEIQSENRSLEAARNFQTRDRDSSRDRDSGRERSDRNRGSDRDRDSEGSGRRFDSRDSNREKQDDSEGAITTGSYSVEDETESQRDNIHSIHKRFNIGDVIKPGQLILIQATKEERGNKGASMTTYISLAGKYCVLMANTPNKGGVSRKVENFRDRKILKAILSDLAVSGDRSMIIRTAGVGKKPEEIKRDCEYLNRLWDSIKEASQSSTAPTFIHAEDDVIKRCLRDVYNEDVAEVVIEGKDAFDKVTSFIKLTMPYQNHNIKFHDERVPVFNKYRVEQQISALYEKNIALKSGGSIVIDHTEALVAIDVNSGRSTKEANVEETAFQTNLEAAKEIAKQLRLRDLAGLIVIDFIDMYDQKHRRQVERTLRDELQNDRARIQLGRISVFGLLELSRQRLGASLFETITQPCTNCNGTGYIRSVEILAVAILRAIRYACADKQAGVIYVYTSNEAIAYMLNFKRRDISATELNYNIHIFLHPSDDVGSAGFTIKKRKSLSSEERRELEMEVVTGKVNLLGLERSYLEAGSESQEEPQIEESRDNRDDRKFDPRRKGGKFRGNNNNNNNRRRDNNNNNKKRYNNNYRDNRGSEGGFMKSIFKIFKSNDNN